MIEAIKKMLAQYKTKQANLRRIKNNRLQKKLILQGIEKRGY